MQIGTFFWTPLNTHTIRQYWSREPQPLKSIEETIAHSHESDLLEARASRAAQIQYTEVKSSLRPCSQINFQFVKYNIFCCTYGSPYHFHWCWLPCFSYDRAIAALRDCLLRWKAENIHVFFWWLMMQQLALLKQPLPKFQLPIRMSDPCHYRTLRISDL